MQSANQQVAVEQDITEMARPEPFVSDRISGDLPVNNERWNSRPGGRETLAASFRKLGRAVQAGTAFEQSKRFFKSSGHSWTRGLN